MTERGLYVRVGLLVTIAIVVLSGFLIVLGDWQFGSGFSLYVDYESAGNVQEGAPVKVSGIRVGKVRQVEFIGGAVDEHTGRRVFVRVHLWLQDEHRNAIRSNAEFFINTAGVIGEQYIEIVPGRFDRSAVAPGSYHIGVDPPRADRMVSRMYAVVDSMASLLAENKPQIRALIANSASTVRELNRLLRDNQQAVSALVTVSESLADEATRLLSDVRHGLDDPRLIGQTTRHANALLDSVRRSIDGLAPRASRLVDEATRATSLATNSRIDRTLAVADTAVSLTGDTAQLVDQVNDLLADLRSGKGTTGAMLIREEVYADVREFVRDLILNPWKLLWKE